MENICCYLLIGIIVFGIVIPWIIDNEKAKKKAEENRKYKIDSVKKELNNKLNYINDQLKMFFDNINEKQFNSTLNIMEEYLDQMVKDSKELESLGETGSYATDMIRSGRLLIEGFERYSKKLGKLPTSAMMDTHNYGRVNKSYWNEVSTITKTNINAVLKRCKQNIDNQNYQNVYDTDVEYIRRCVWFYALEKPFSSDSFKMASDLYKSLVDRDKQVDVFIAELYALKQMGAEDIIRKRVNEHIKDRYSHESYTVKELALLASGLMWINEYQLEKDVLQYMVKEGMGLSQKLQQRLHALAATGGKMPAGYSVSSNADTIYFDVSALSWNDDEYNGFFDNLSFQDKKLSYSLAVRDEDKDLFITNGLSVPDTSTILQKLKRVFANEYGNAVSAIKKNCIALSGSNQETMEGILVQSYECRQMGILVHIARIGKKLNIKFYTLYMPGSSIDSDHQQAISLKKKLSPTVHSWEGSLKDTILMGIQQLLNARQPSNEPNVEVDDMTDDGGTPIF